MKQHAKHMNHRIADHCSVTAPGGRLHGQKMSQLYIVDVLFREYYRRNPQVSRENNHRTSKAVVDKLY